MILCKSRKFLFIKGRKVAGTSVEMALSALCGPGDIVTPITPRDEQARFPNNARNYSDDPDRERAYVERCVAGLSVPVPEEKYFNHMSVSDVQTHFGDLSGFEILFVERNPYFKAISWANWRLGQSRYNTGGELNSDVDRVRRQISQGLESGKILRVRNIDLYRYRGAVPAGWRYETLQEQFAAWMKDKGIAQLPHAKRGLLSNRLAIREWLSRAQIARITELFWDEFEAFGYRPLA